MNKDQQWSLFRPRSDVSRLRRPIVKRKAVFREPRHPGEAWLPSSSSTQLLNHNVERGKEISSFQVQSGIVIYQASPRSTGKRISTVSSYRESIVLRSLGTPHQQGTELGNCSPRFSCQSHCSLISMPVLDLGHKIVVGAECLFEVYYLQLCPFLHVLPHNHSSSPAFLLTSFPTFQHPS